MLAHPFPPKHKRKQEHPPIQPRRSTGKSPANAEQACHDVLDLLARAHLADARSILSAVSCIKPYSTNLTDLAKLRSRLEAKGFGAMPEHSEFAHDQEPHDWMLRVMQGAYSASNVRQTLCDVPGLDEVVKKARDGSLKDRKRAMSVLSRLRKIPLRVAARFLCNSPNSILKHWKIFSTDGVQSLFASFRTPRRRKAQDEDVKKAVFAVLHAPPQVFNINRTTWKMEDLKTCLARNGTSLSKDIIREVIKSAGYKWRKAKIVLTSNDPEYREKLDHIQRVLSNLRDDERFLSIDEFGPFAVKAKGGTRLVTPGVYPSVPQFQKSKGRLILTAALELSRNQVTHFYSTKKDTEEMVKLLHVLLDQHMECSKLYLSWDAASWHASNLLYETVETVNSNSYRREHGTAFVDLAPLPASAQFLNIIESVFSGMAKAIIHNSDYECIEAAMAAINRHFAERNEHFRQHPKRAGKKIWGKELVPAVFDESQNCKNPRW